MGENNAGPSDAFVFKLNTAGVLQWISQLGSATVAPGGDNVGSDNCYGIAVDSAGTIYCAGGTNGNFGEANTGSSDAFIFKLTPK
jgi:hypothetical protein